jgi:hypothetical protein
MDPADIVEHRAKIRRAKQAVKDEYTIAQDSDDVVRTESTIEQLPAQSIAKSRN